MRQVEDITDMIGNIPDECPICKRRIKVRPKRKDDKYYLNVQRIFSNKIHDPPIKIIVCGSPDCKYILARRLRDDMSSV